MAKQIKKLKAKHYRKITKYMAFMYFVVMTGFILRMGLNLKDFLTVFFVLSGIGTIIIWWSFYYVIFEIPLKELEEFEEVQKRVNRSLKIEKFTEVLFEPLGNGSDFEMIMGFFKTEGNRFFAKINEKNEITLEVREQESELIMWSESIKNLQYFCKTFKLKK